MRVLISGYYGFQNGGDEALLSGMLHALSEAGPVDPTVLSHDPRATEELHGVRAIQRDHVPTLWRQLKQRTDLFISGGGGLIQDRTSRRSALYYLGLIRLAQRAGVPTYLYAQGVGPVDSRLVRAIARRTLPNIVGAGARDPQSARYFVDLGVEEDRVRVTADAAFALAGQPPAPSDLGVAGEKILRALGLSIDDRPLIGVIWRNPIVTRRRGRVVSSAESVPGGGGGATADAVAATAKTHVAHGVSALAREIDGCVVVMGLYPGQDDEEGDALEHALAEAGCPRVERIRDDYDFRTMRAVIGATDINVSVRYHGVLFSALGGVPAVAIEYDPKVRHLAHQLGLPSVPVSVDGTTLFQTLHTLWHDSPAEKERLAGRVAVLHRQALDEGARALELAGGGRKVHQET